MNIKNRSISFDCNYQSYKNKYDNKCVNHTHFKETEQILDFILIDDDEIDASMTRNLFQRLPLHNPLHLFYDTSEAMKYFEMYHRVTNVALHSIVLLDQNMPATTGLEFLEELRRTPEISELPVFLLTHLSDEKTIFKACENYAQGFFVKPLNMTELATQISTLPGYGYKSIDDGLQFIKNL